MILEALRARDLRNLEDVELRPSRGLTVLVGPNGAGKTNLLEAVYLLATQRPLRPARLAELIRHGARRAAVEGRCLGEVHAVLGVTLEEGRRRASIDSKVVRSLAAWATHLPVVAFTPDDLEIAKAGPQARRAWLDRAVFGHRPGHLQATRRYGRALSARNRLLREGAPRQTVVSFDPILIAEGARILEGRRQVLARIAERARHVSDTLLGEARLRLEVRYRSRVDPMTSGEHVSEQLRVALEASRREERARGRTCVGPHLDDVELLLGGQALRTFGSQGQQRAVVLALKIAEIEVLAESRGAAPLLLLDDISSELDPARRAALFAYLQGFAGQTLLTTTDLASVDGGILEGSAIVSVRAGFLEPGGPRS